MSAELAIQGGGSGIGTGLQCDNIEPENQPVKNPITAEDKAAREAARLVSAPSPYQAQNPIPTHGATVATGATVKGAYSVSPTFNVGVLEHMDGWKDLGQHVPGAAEALSGTYNALTAVDEAHKVLARDTGKTDQQRLAVLAASSTKAYDRAFVAISTSIQNIHSGIARYQRELDQPYEAKGSIPLAAEMRALFRSKTSEQKAGIISDAIASNDQTVLAAILGVHPQLSEVDPRLHKLWQRRLAEKQSPETIRRIALMSKAAETLGRALNALPTEFERAMRGKFAEASKIEAFSNDSAIALAKIRGERVVG